MKDNLVIETDTDNEIYTTRANLKKVNTIPSNSAIITTTRMVQEQPWTRQSAMCSIRSQVFPEQTGPTAPVTCTLAEARERMKEKKNEIKKEIAWFHVSIFLFFFSQKHSGHWFPH